MSIQLTLDIFSGRPNPTVKLKGKAEARFLEQVKPARRLRVDEPGLPPLARLGYRGVIVGQRQDRRGLPMRFRIAGQDAFGRGLEHRVADSEVESYLLDPDGPFRRIGDLELDWDRIRFEAATLREWREHLILEETRPLTPVVACSCGPLWEPSWWNDPSRVYDNNCYNYGTNYRTDSYAQPGRAAGAMYTSLSPVAVREAAEADELLHAPCADNDTCPTEGHLVALFVDPGWDFHWYRKDANGWWSHKMGWTPVSDKDNDGKFISDPRTADTGGYLFTAFMVVKHGHIKIT